MSKKICFSSLFIYFMVMCLFVVLRICSYYGVFSFLGDYSSIVLTLITQIFLLCFLPLYIFKKSNKASNENMKTFCKLKKTSSKVILSSILLGFVVFFVNLYVSSFFNTIIQEFGYTPNTTTSSGAMSWGSFILELFLTAFLPAVCEELLHRGMLLSGMSCMGMKKSIIFSGILFGLLHLNIEQVFYAAVIGIFLGYLCCGCNSIYPCMIVHFMNNAISVTLSFMSSRGINLLSGLTNFLQSGKVFGFLILILFLILLLYVGYGLVDSMFRESFRFNFVEKQKELSTKAIRENFFADVERIKGGQSEGERIYTAERNVIKINLSQFMQIVSKNINEVKMQKPPAKAVEKKSNNMDLKIQILLWGSIVLGVVINILTFVWGLMR